MARAKRVDKESVIRIAQDKDLLEITAMEAQTNSHPWSEAMLLSSFETHDVTVLEHPVQKGIQAYLISQTVCDEASLLHILVSSEHQSKGYGRCLLESWESGLAEGVKSVWLEVRESNRVAQKLYETYGFVLTSKRENYYKTLNSKQKETALIYKLER